MAEGPEAGGAEFLRGRRSVELEDGWEGGLGQGDSGEDSTASLVG